MNIQTVRKNLRNIIAGKEQHLKTLGSDLLCGDYVNRTATVTTIELLKINIGELKGILQDVESCVDKDVEQSWRDNPDRMSGSFTQDEIDNARAWR